MLIYIGGGAFLPDVPARDLNDDEVARYGGERYLLASGLYRKQEKPRPQSNKMAKGPTGDKEV